MNDVTTFLLMRFPNGDDVYPIKVGGKDPMEGELIKNEQDVERAKYVEKRMKSLKQQLSKKCNETLQKELDELSAEYIGFLEANKEESIKDVKYAYVAWIPKTIAGKVDDSTKTVSVETSDGDFIDVKVKSITLNPRNKTKLMQFIDRPFFNLKNEDIHRMLELAARNIKKIPPQSSCSLET